MLANTHQPSCLPSPRETKNDHLYSILMLAVFMSIGCDLKSKSIACVQTCHYLLGHPWLCHVVCWRSQETSGLGRAVTHCWRQGASLLVWVLPCHVRTWRDHLQCTWYDLLPCPGMVICTLRYCTSISWHDMDMCTLAHCTVMSWHDLLICTPGQCTGINCLKPLQLALCKVTLGQTQWWMDTITD